MTTTDKRSPIDALRSALVRSLPYATSDARIDELVEAIDRYANAKLAEACRINPLSSRACERGTRSCVVVHGAEAERGVAGIHNATVGPSVPTSMRITHSSATTPDAPSEEGDDAGRLIAAAVAAKDRELADVRDEWRKCRVKLAEAEREIGRLRGTLDDISEHRGFVVSAEYGRIEEADYMRQMANESLQHVPPYVPTSDGRAAPSEEGDGPEVDTSDWQVPPVPESVLREKLAAADRRIDELDANALDDGKRIETLNGALSIATGKLADADRRIASLLARIEQLTLDRDAAVRRAEESETRASEVKTDRDALWATAYDAHLDLAEAWRWIECGRSWTERQRTMHAKTRQELEQAQAALREARAALVYAENGARHPRAYGRAIEAIDAALPGPDCTPSPDAEKPKRCGARTPGGRCVLPPDHPDECMSKLPDDAAGKDA